MKHLTFYKLFESSSIQYEEITESEYNILTLGWNGEDDDYFGMDEFTEEKWVTFNNKEIEIIRNMIPDIELDDIGFAPKESRISSIKSHLVIIKLLDEWYVVVSHQKAFEFKFFKCDQIDGVIQLIKKLKS